MRPYRTVNCCTYLPKKLRYASLKQNGYLEMINCKLLQLMSVTVLSTAVFVGDAAAGHGNNTLLGGLFGGAAGAGIGGAFGGRRGAAIGGIAGLGVGALLGHVIGKKNRPQPAPTYVPPPSYQRGYVAPPAYQQGFVAPPAYQPGYAAPPAYQQGSAAPMAKATR